VDAIFGTFARITSEIAREMGLPRENNSPKRVNRQNSVSKESKISQFIPQIPANNESGELLLQRAKRKTKNAKKREHKTISQKSSHFQCEPI